MKVKAHIAYMDIVKAFAIIAVVVGHSGSPLTQIVYMYHVPLFFFIAGYFYNDSYSKAPFLLLKKRLKTLYLPFVGYELLFLALHNIFFELNIYSDKAGYGNTVSHLYTTQEFAINAVKILAFIGTEELLGPLWFILSLFTVTIFFGFISYLTTKYVKGNPEYFRFSVIFLAFLIGNLTTYYGLTFYFVLNTSLVAILIYYIGYMFRKYEDKIAFNPHFLTISLLFLIMSSLYGPIDMASNSYLSPSFLIANSLAGAYINIYLAKRIVSTEINYTILEYIGKNTFAIMALHYISFKLINLIQVRLNDLPVYMVAKYPVIDGTNGWWILYSVCGVFLPLVVIYTINKFIQKFENKRKFKNKNFDL
ncbi:acyltransferase family protein [Methanosarcina sp.]|uniref:acyltransferase family protein n=1 Tax=Methanosarcina sp. TaxID=2213 RepID=UPI003C72B92A